MSPPFRRVFVFDMLPETMNPVFPVFVLRESEHELPRKVFGAEVEGETTPIPRVITPWALEMSPEVFAKKSREKPAKPTAEVGDLSDFFGDKWVIFSLFSMLEVDAWVVNVTEVADEDEDEDPWWDVAWQWVKDDEVLLMGVSCPVDNWRFE